MGRLIASTDVVQFGAGRPVKIGLIGSSSLADAHATKGFNKNKRTDGLAYWSEIKSRGLIQIPQALNYAVGGSVSTDFIVSIDTKMAAIAAAGAGAVLISSGSNNDARLAIDPAVTIANYQTILTAAAKAGLLAMISAPTPRGTATFTSVALTTVEVRRTHTLRSWILGLRGQAGIYVIDTWPDFADPASTNGGILDAMTRDGQHLSTAGMAVWGQHIADAVTKLFPNGNRMLLPCAATDIYDPANVRGARVPNPMMQGTSGTLGTLAGTLATGYSSEYSGAGGTVRTGSQVTVGSKLWQQVAWSAQVISGYQGFKAVVDKSDLAAGDQIIAACDFEIDSGHNNLRSLILKLGATAATINSGGAGDTAAGTFPTGAVSGVLVTDPLVLDATLLSQTIEWSLRAYPDNTAAASTVTFRAGAATVYKIN